MIECYNHLVPDSDGSYFYVMFFRYAYCSYALLRDLRPRLSIDLLEPISAPELLIYASACLVDIYLADLSHND